MQSLHGRSQCLICLLADILCLISALGQDRKYPRKSNKPCLCPVLKATVITQPPNTWQLLLIIKLWNHHCLSRTSQGKMLFGLVLSHLNTADVFHALIHCDLLTAAIRKSMPYILICERKCSSICLKAGISFPPIIIQGKSIQISAYIIQYHFFMILIVIKDAQIPHSQCGINNLWIAYFKKLVTMMSHDHDTLQEHHIITIISHFICLHGLKHKTWKVHPDSVCMHVMVMWNHCFSCMCASGEWLWGKLR